MTSASVVRQLVTLIRIARRPRQVFWQDSCKGANSYYFDKNGDVALRPAHTFEVYWRSRRFDLDDYRFTG